MASTATAAPPRQGRGSSVQKFGTFLSNMIMPNIGAFIAWGLITAFFIQTRLDHPIGDKISATIVELHDRTYGFVSPLGGGTPTAAASSAR